MPRRQKLSVVVGLKNPDGGFGGAVNLRCDGLPEASEDQVTIWLEPGSEEKVFAEIAKILGAKRTAQVFCHVVSELIRLTAISLVERDLQRHLAELRVKRLLDVG